MGNRIFTVVVLALWAVTMSWLVVAHVLPPFFQGEPPSIGSLADQSAVCWQIKCLNEEVGWAVSQAAQESPDTTDLHSRIVLENIPLREMAPRWMSAIVDHLGQIKLDMRNRISLDSFGQLTAFDTQVRLNNMPAVIKMHGRCNGSDLQLRIVTGDITHRINYPMPQDSTLTGELTPDAKLLQLFVGRRWQREVISPFRPLNQSIEILQAEVVTEEPVHHEGQLVNTKRVEYRTLDNTGIAAKDSLRAKLWVTDDGTVIRQDIFLINVRLRFDRKLDDQSLAWAEQQLGLDSVTTATNPPHHKPEVPNNSP
jgi:hypothetical protein